MANILKKTFLFLIIVIPIITFNYASADYGCPGSTQCLDVIGNVDGFCAAPPAESACATMNNRKCCNQDPCNNLSAEGYSCVNPDGSYDCKSEWYCMGGVNRKCCKAGSSSGSGSTSGGGLQNPLPVNDIPSFMGIVIRGLLGIVGTLSLAMFIYGGFLWITSGGNEDAIKKGKNTIMWAILGIVIIFTSYAILNFVLKIIGGAG